jgi:uncharacterized protein (DUF433 family)
MTTIVPLEYIEGDDRGVAKLIGTRVKVEHLVAIQQREGFSAEELIEQYPDLGPARVYAALAYYYDHKAEVDRQIEEGVRFADEMRMKHPNRSTRAELEQRWSRLRQCDHRLNRLVRK